MTPKLRADEAPQPERADAAPAPDARPDFAVPSPQAVLALQRTAGNSAVVRALGRAGRPVLQRAPSADPNAADFWDVLSRDTVMKMIAWINAHQFQAIEQFSDDMSTGGGADAGEIVANSTIDFVSAIPVTGNFAAALLNLVKMLYDGITADEPMKLPAFLARSCATTAPRSATA